MININFDTAKLQEKLNSLAGQLSGKEMGRSIALGINETLRNARATASTEIRKVFNLRREFVSTRLLKIKQAKNGHYVGEVLFPTKPIPMGEFLGTKGGVKKKGQPATQITVEIIKGQPKILNGAFFLQSKYSPGNSNLSIAHRSFSTGGSSYSAGSFKFRHKRTAKGGNDLSIGVMMSPSPMGTVINDIVKKNLRVVVEEKLLKNVFKILDKNVAGLIRQSNRGGRFR